MSLKNLLQTRLTEQFIIAKLDGANSLAPRNGYYFIKEVNYQGIADKGKFPIATVLWKTTEDGPFLKDVSFPISLSSLALGEPLDYLNMANKTIRIYNVGLVRINEESNAMRLVCEYKVINQKPVFTTGQSLVLSIFGGNASTLSEAYRNYENDLGIDLSGAIESETPTDGDF